MRVAFMMQGNGTSWIGGTEYIRNLIISCGNLPPEERSQFEMVLICDESFDPRSVSDLNRYLARTYQFPADLPDEVVPRPGETAPRLTGTVPVVTDLVSIPPDLPARRRGLGEKLWDRIFRKAAARKVETHQAAVKVRKEAQKAALKIQKEAQKAARKAAQEAAAQSVVQVVRRPNGQMADFLAQEKIDFLYPVIFHRFDAPIGNSLGNCRWAGWVPDFQYRHMPEFYAPDVLERREAGLTTFFNDAETIIFSSYNAEADYKRFYPGATAGGEVMRFHTFPQDNWYQGDPVEVQHKFNLPDRFLIVSNQFWQHKNHMGLFEAMALLLAAGEPVPDIVCTGHPTDGRNPRYIDQILRTIHAHGLAGHVRLVGLIDRAEQILLVRRSVAVIQPSLFEGWSTIVEDSRILGKRMVMSDIAVHKEQDPPHGVYFEQGSARSLADALSKVWQTGSPGPDLEREGNARRQGVEDALTYARQFLEIARKRQALKTPGTDAHNSTEVVPPLSPPAPAQTLAEPQVNIPSGPRLLFVYPPGRLKRLERARAGEIPTELFFGSIEIEKAGAAVECIEFDIASWSYILGEKIDRWVNQQFADDLAGRGLLGATRMQRELPAADCIVAVDENAGLGISLLAMVGELATPVVCIKCRLSRARPLSAISRYLISRLTKAAHTVFIGRTEADTMPKRYKLGAKEFTFNSFGVDDTFWAPAPASARAEHVLAIGDSSRDYETLMRAAPQVGAPIKIVSGLQVQHPLPKNVTWQQGNWRKETLSDVEIRDLYRKAICVVVPLHERLEPSGQSVCLQAMSCGKPVILTRSPGLQDLGLKDGENLLLVNPGDSEGIASAIKRLIEDPALAERLGKEARAEVCRSFRISQFAERLQETCRVASEQEAS